MKFDYVLTNPPFTLGTHNTIYRVIIERMMKRANCIYFIGPSGVLGKNMWQKHKNNIIKASRLGWDYFPVDIGIGSALWKRNPTDNEKRDCEFIIEGGSWKINKKEFPSRVPFVKMTKDEYREVFDQNGVDWQPFKKTPQPGVYRDRKCGFVYSDEVSLDFIEKPDNKSGFIAIKNPENGKKLAGVLSILEKDKKIHGFWGRSYRHVTVDLDPIRKDLT